MHLVDEIISMGKVAIPLEQGQVLKKLTARTWSSRNGRDPFGAGTSFKKSLRRRFRPTLSQSLWSRGKYSIARGFLFPFLESVFGRAGRRGILA